MSDIGKENTGSLDLPGGSNETADSPPASTDVEQGDESYLPPGAEEYRGDFGFTDQPGSEHPIAEDLTPDQGHGGSSQIAETDRNIAPGVYSGLGGNASTVTSRPESRRRPRGPGVVIRRARLEREAAEEAARRASEIPRTPPANVPRSPGSAGVYDGFPGFGGSGQPERMSLPRLPSPTEDTHSNDGSLQRTSEDLRPFHDQFRLEPRWRNITVPSSRNNTSTSVWASAPEYEDAKVNPDDDTPMKGQNKVVTMGARGDPPEMEDELARTARAYFEREATRARNSRDTSPWAAEQRNIVFERDRAIEGREEIEQPQEVRDWELWARKSENEGDEGRRLGNAMLKAMQGRLTEMLGDVNGELAKRLNAKYESKALKKQLEDEAGRFPREIHDQAFLERAFTLEAELKRLKDTKDTEIEKLKEKINTLRDEAQVSLSSHESIIDQLEQARKRTVSLETSIKNSKREYKVLESAKSKAVTQLTKELELAKESSTEKAEALKQCDRENEELRDTIRSKINDRTAQIELSNRDTQIKLLTKQLRDKTAEYDAQGKVINQLDTTIKELKEDVEKSGTSHDVIRTLNEKIGSQAVILRANEGEMNRLRSERDNLRAVHERETREELEENEILLTEARQLCEELERRAEELERAAREDANTIQNHRHTEAACRLKVEALESEKEELDRLCKKFTAERANLSDYIAGLFGFVRKRKEEEIDATENTQIRDESKSAEKRDVADQLLAIAGAMGEFAALETSYNNLVTQYNKDMEDFGEKEIQYLEEKLTLKKNVSTLEADLTRLKEKDNENFNSQMQKQIAVSDARMKNLEAQVAINADLRRDLSSCHTEKRKLTSELDICKEKSRELKGQLDDLKNQFRKEGSGSTSQGLSSAIKPPVDIAPRQSRDTQYVSSISSHQHSTGLTIPNIPTSRAHSDPGSSRRSLALTVARCHAALREMRDERAQHGFQEEDTDIPLSIAKEIWSISSELPEDVDGVRNSYLAHGAYLQGVSHYYEDELQQSRGWFEVLQELTQDTYSQDMIDRWLHRITEGGPDKEPRYYLDPHKGKGEAKVRKATRPPPSQNDLYDCSDDDKDGSDERPGGSTTGENV